MGCWCETDGVTQLPINYGDKVRHFVLVYEPCWRFAKDGNAGGGTCYSTDIWAPLGPAIQGTYDDYGGIKDIVENQDTNMLVELIKKEWVPFEEKWEKVTPINEMELSEILHWIERDKVQLKPYMKDYRRHLGQMMVHEAVYQAMISHDFIDCDYGPGDRKFRPFSEILTARMRRWYENGLSTARERLAPDTTPEQKAFCESHLYFDTEFFSGGESSFRGINEYRWKMIPLILELVPFEDEKVQKLVRPVLELCRFERAMGDARKMWIPQCGKGGQHNELYLYRRISEAANQVMSADEERMKEDLGDEYEPHDPMKLSSWQIEHNEKSEQQKD